MSNEERLSIIEKAVYMADIAIPNYLQHLEAVLFWSGIKKEKQETILSDLKMLEHSSKRRAKNLKELKENLLNYDQ